MLKRKKAGIRYAVYLAKTQRNLADVLGVSTGAVNRWVRQGYVTDKDKIKEIYERYGISPAWLFDPEIVELISLPDVEEK